MNVQDIMDANEIFRKAKEQAYAIACAITAQEARSYDSLLTEERVQELCEDGEYDYLCDRKWGHMESRAKGYSRHHISAITVDGNNVKFGFAHESWDEYFCTYFEVSHTLFNAFGTNDQNLMASEVRKYIEPMLSKFRQILADRIQDEKDQSERDKKRQEERDKAEFLRLSKKFPNGIPEEQ